MRRVLVAGFLCLGACTCQAPATTPMPSASSVESVPYRQPASKNGSSAPPIDHPQTLVQVSEAQRVPTERELAYHLATRCDADEASACHLLAYLYREGIDVAASQSHAAVLSRRACGAGHAAACEGAQVTPPTELPEATAGLAGRVARLEACVAGLVEACGGS